MFSKAGKDATRSKISARLNCTLALTLTFGAVLLTAFSDSASKDPQMGSMPGMDMGGKSGKNEMGDMGQSMEAMMGHMKITPLLVKQPGDEEKARAVIAETKAVTDKYKDYRKAVADGYAIANPKVEQTQYHFINKANWEEADVRFDASKPTALLYFRTPHKDFTLEGVMYTAARKASDDELNQRIPLSIARWHEHVDYCAAPADRTKEYFGAHPKFGMFGSIRTKEACDAARGEFQPIVFTWMLHVFPYEKDFKDIFSMNDDISHVH